MKRFIKKYMSLFFETIKYLDGEFFNLSAHQARIERTFGSFFPGCTPFLLSQILTFEENGLFRCKVVYGRDILEVAYFSYKKREIDTFFISECDITYDFKFANREFFEKKREGLKDNEEILFFKNGLLCDTTFSNVAILLDDEWITPKKPLLEGCMLNTLMIKREDITKDMVKESKKIALINSMIGFSEINLKEIKW